MSKKAASSTTRLPSGFEATEDKERRCSQCRLTGYTRASPRCLVNICRLKEEFAPRSASQSNPDPDLWVPRSLLVVTSRDHRTKRSEVILSL